MRRFFGRWLITTEIRDKEKWIRINCNSELVNVRKSRYTLLWNGSNFADTKELSSTVVKDLLLFLFIVGLLAEVNEELV